MTITKTASRREIFGWAMFDFANQAYTTLIITVIYKEKETFPDENYLSRNREFAGIRKPDRLQD